MGERELSGTVNSRKLSGFERSIQTLQDQKARATSPEMKARIQKQIEAKYIKRATPKENRLSSSVRAKDAAERANGGMPITTRKADSAKERTFKSKTASTLTNIQAMAVDAGKSPTINVTPNRLDKYASYTYNIELYALTPTIYNNIMADPDGQHSDGLLLVSSSGKKSELGSGFFIDDLEFDTIGPTSEHTRNTNSMNIKFSITEVYGMTLLERLLDISKYRLGLPQAHYTQTPYMLKLTFKGYDVNGNPKSEPSLDKYLPIQIYEMKFDVSAAGTIYVAKAVPFNHSAFSSEIETLPMDFELSAETVPGYFTTEGKGEITTNTTERNTETGKNTTVKQRSSTSGTLIEILNNRQRIMSETTQTADAGKEAGSKPKHTRKVPDTYKIEFAKEFNDAKLEFVNHSPQSTITPRNKLEQNEFYKNFVDSVRGKHTVNTTGSTIRVNAGTSLVELIGILLIQSTYLSDQFKGDASKPKDESLRWFKITPSIQIGKWDDVKNRHAYNITYYIAPYFVDNIKYKSRNKAIPRGKLLGDGYHKEYDYMYTGNNSHVLNFDIKYNIAYQTVSTNTTITGSDSLAIDGSGVSSVKTEAKPQGMKIAQVSDINGTNGNALTGHDLMNDVLTDGADLFDLNLEIIGDPDWIMQNDAYKKSLMKDPLMKSAYLPNNGSINYDYSQVYAKLNFNTPVDYDEETGIMDIAKSIKSKPLYNTSTQFGGIYQIWKVKNSLSGGVFTQTLHGVRVIDKKEKTEQEREAPVKEKNRVPYGPPVPPRLNPGPKTVSKEFVADLRKKDARARAIEADNSVRIKDTLASAPSREEQQARQRELARLRKEQAASQPGLLGRIFG